MLFYNLYMYMHPIYASIYASYTSTHPSRGTDQCGTWELPGMQLASSKATCSEACTAMARRLVLKKPWHGLEGYDRLSAYCS